MQEPPSLTVVSTAQLAPNDAVSGEPDARSASSPQPVKGVPHAPRRNRFRDMDRVVWCLLLVQIAILLAAGWIGA